MEQKKSMRGFAAMDPEKRREIAQKGGRSVPKEKRSFARNKALATEAGRKGGQATPAAKRSFTLSQELASQAGRRGGASSKKK